MMSLKDASEQLLAIVERCETKEDIGLVGLRLKFFRQGLVDVEIFKGRAGNHVIPGFANVRQGILGLP